MNNSPLHKLCATASESSSTGETPKRETNFAIILANGTEIRGVEAEVLWFIQTAFHLTQDPLEIILSMAMASSLWNVRTRRVLWHRSTAIQVDSKKANLRAQALSSMVSQGRSLVQTLPITILSPLEELSLSLTPTIVGLTWKNHFTLKSCFLTFWTSHPLICRKSSCQKLITSGSRVSRSRFRKMRE
jgi:hypothetical protein